MNLCNFPTPTAILLIHFLQNLNGKVENYALDQSKGL